jgi:translation initiation factor 3 subunit D
MASFKAPVINDNPDGWGPPLDLAPARFQDMPYAPFSKSDRLGRAADWTNNRSFADPAAASDFTTVDTKVLPRAPSRGAFRGGGGMRGGGGGGRGGGAFNDRGRGGGSGRGGATRGRGAPGSRRWDDRRNYQREASVDVGPAWALLEEVTGSAMSKLSYAKVSAPEDIVTCGSVRFYDRTFDRITAKNPKPLKTFDDLDSTPVTTTSDPVIRRIAGSGVGSVFATASILSLIMVAPRSVQSWDIVVQRIGGKLFLDTRENSLIDMPTVNETSHDAPKDEKALQPDEIVNSSQKLSEEAASINHNFSQAALLPAASAGTMDYSEPNPFDPESDDDEEGIAPRASVAYRYRKWTLGGIVGEDGEETGGITIVARCEVNGALKKDGASPELMSIKTLNEYFDKNARQSTDWRAKLDVQRGAVLATEVKNNANKLARWTTEAILADVGQLKFGFVSRVRANESSPHTILGTQMYRPKEFALQINLNLNNMWGILKQVIDLCFKHMEDGNKAVLVKDPNKIVLRLYSVPAQTFEADGDDDDDE